MKGTHKPMLWIERDLSCYGTLAGYDQWNSLMNYVSWQFQHSRNSRKINTAGIAEKFLKIIRQIKLTFNNHFARF